MVHFHQDEKPTTGTRLPIQAATGMINTTCAPLNVKVTMAEWTPSQNLILCFSQGSIESQIKKAGSTILGTIARDCPRAIFMKCEKWSRIVVHNIPTQRWCYESSSIIDVTREVIESETRQAHPLLTDAMFTESPNWTAKEGPSPGSTHANISFAIPDHNESRLREVTSRPLAYFGSYCPAV